MRLYEVVYIFDASLDEAAVNQRLERFHGILTGDGARITEVDHWGSRQLAYPIARQQMGYYVVAQFEAESPSLVEFERIVRLDESVLRYLLVLNEGEPTSGLSIVAERPASERDDEDEDDDDDEDEDDDQVPEFRGGQGRRRRIEGPAITLLNYKDVPTLSRFLTESGKILPKRTTRVTARFQRRLGSAVKRARYLALIPYMRDHEV